MGLKEKIDEAVNFIRSRSGRIPEFAIVLGTGLGGMVRELQDREVIPYEEIPGFALSTAPGHKGELLMGKIGTRSVAVMEGRLHYYEGYSMQDITFPVRVMKGLGAKSLIVSNASGGLNPLFQKGDLMIIDDHINLMGDNPLRGPNDERLGPRFPDMSRPYDPEFINLVEEIALREGIKIHRGVYVALAGPNLETRAEYRFLRTIGADAVGMSTVPEVIVAVHSGLRVFGISIITDMGLPDALKPVDIREIIEVANRAEPLMTKIIIKFISSARL
jgi:purine-nucleoside phosphorylase